MTPPMHQRDHLVKSAHKSEVCHSERSAAESKNLRTFEIFQLKSVRRSFDSLRSLRMTYREISASIEPKTYSQMVGGVMSPPYEYIV